MQTAIDLFDGCGGMGHALSNAGYDVLGVESWSVAADSSRAAGHRVLNVDVRTLNPRDFHGFNHFHASPPCTTFSAAGRGAGREHLEELRLAVKRVLQGFPADYSLQGSRTAQFKQVGNAVPPPVGLAVVEALR